MTTPYKQALDDLYLTELEDWTRENMPLIRRALLIADAVENSYVYGGGHGEWGRGHNDCIEQLREIGAGE